MQKRCVSKRMAKSSSKSFRMTRGARLLLLRGLALRHHLLLEVYRAEGLRQ